MRDVELMERAIRNSFAVGAAFAEVPSTSEDSPSDSDAVQRKRKLIGFVRVISDGSFAALLVDVAVAKGYQRRGIGRKMVKKTISALRKYVHVCQFMHTLFRK